MRTERPRILVTNDDGIRARGLVALAQALDSVGEVTVVAPDREQSATSHAMTIRSPLRITPHAARWFSVDGTPTDCVNLAFFHILGSPPDLVVSGINAGFNLGEDVTYSGTVAGALEGRILGAPAMAVSADVAADDHTLGIAASIGARVAGRVLAEGLSADSFLNINVPVNPRGVAVTRQGKRAFREGVVARRDPKGNEYYWIGLAPSEWQNDPEADHAAVALGLVSITPLHSDMTCHPAVGAVRGWNLQKVLFP